MNCSRGLARVFDADQIVGLTAFGGSDDCDQPVQQRAAGRPRRVSLELPKSGAAGSIAHERAEFAAGRACGTGGPGHRRSPRPGACLGAGARARGAHVVALDVARALEYPGYGLGTSADLDSLQRACRALGVECLTFAADVRDDAAIAAAVAATAERFGRIDILFNNAGICAYGLAHELTEDAWDTMLDINLKGAWMVARRVIPHMMARRSGVIINNSSVAGLRGMSRLSHYAASKWGLVGLTKSWAIELAPHGIRVISIHPTGVNTPMNDGLAELEGLTPDASRRTLGRQPAASALGRARRRG